MSYKKRTKCGFTDLSNTSWTHPQFGNGPPVHLSVLEMCFIFTFLYKILYQSTLQYTFYNHVFDATLLIYGGPRPSNQKSCFITQLTLGLHVVLIW